MKGFIIILISVMGFTNYPVSYLKKYEKKINKEIKKVFEKDEIHFEVFDLMQNPGLEENNSFYKLISDNKTIGFVNINKVNACQIGGCNRPVLLNTVRYDHFHYMAVFDAEFSILKVSVLDYQSEYGYEICSKNWLKQFKGSPEKYFEYDENIDAISGATVSAEAMVDEINSLKKLVQIIHNNEN